MPHQHCSKPAAFSLFPVGIAGIGNDVQAPLAERLLRGFGHRLQRAVVRCIQCDGMGDDQCVFGIDRGLHVVGPERWNRQPS